MRRTAAAAIALLLGLTLFNGLVTGPATAATAPAQPALAMDAATVVPQLDLAPLARKKKKAKKKKATPLVLNTGVMFNEATASNASKFRIMNRLVKSIRSTPRGARIEIMSWNVLSPRAVNALIAAHKRGVTVRVLMDGVNTKLALKTGKRKGLNKQWLRLRRGLLGNHNVKRQPALRSYAKVCKGACRRSGAGGAAHSKFFLFSQTGGYQNVVIQGSHNLTTAAAINQWNDVFTTVNDEAMYNFVRGVFGQMWADKEANPGWVGHSTSIAGSTEPNYDLYFSPRTGSTYTNDPLLTTLEKVKCTGVTAGAGNAKGRTVIRIAPDVVRGGWGLRAATRVKQLWDQGCDVRMGYTVLGYDIYKVLRGTGGRGPVPMRHLIQDFDGDGYFDRYFHLKVWAINGVIGDDTAAYWTMNGSSNVSGASSNSDENVGFIRDKTTTLRYQTFINKWFDNPPKSKPSKKRLAPGADPYEYVDMD